jgi:hypothetical protein
VRHRPPHVPLCVSRFDPRPTSWRAFLVNGAPHDHPITDMLLHGMHPFPADIEALIRRVNAIDPQLLAELGAEPFAWEKGEKLDEARATLKALLQRHGPP